MLECRMFYILYGKQRENTATRYAFYQVMLSTFVVRISYGESPVVVTPSRREQVYNPLKVS